MNRAVLPLGAPRPERADAVRNRLLLLSTAREMISEQGVDKVTMDALAERAGLGKGTVFRRFGSRAGIFHALLDDDERALQEQVLSGPAPLGPGAGAVERLVAYGRARIAFQLAHYEIARAALDGSRPAPAGEGMSRLHIRMLLGRTDLVAADLDMLAVQLTAALEGPFLLYLCASPQEPATDHTARMSRAWQDLVERVCRA